MPQSRHSVLPIATAALLLACASLAVAETSSWSQRTTVAPRRDAAPQSEPSVPSPVTSKKVRTAPATGAARADGMSAHAKARTGSDEDEAYFAFDQGRYLTALDLAQKAAAKGDPQAHTLIGRIYEEGYAVPKDEAAAAKWYQKGAELGDIEAVFALGVLAAQGRGVPKDMAVAGRYFETAAAKGHVVANYNLALLFLRGDGKPENPHRAFMHMRYAAENGVVAAQYDLGTLYATGAGVEANAFLAAQWIARAANAGHTEAAVEYAVLLFKGHGVQPDQKRGARLFRQAAEKGVAVAQNRLARCYANGAGVEKNPREAAKWHLIAQAGGALDEELDKIVARLPRAERQAAEQAAADWQSRTALP
jgi:uncharacterized protein